MCELCVDFMFGLPKYNCLETAKNITGTSLNKTTVHNLKNTGIFIIYHFLKEYTGDLAIELTIDRLKFFKQ